MAERHPSQISPSSSCELPRKIRCHSQLREHSLDKTFQDPESSPASQVLKMAIGQMRTRYQVHLDLGCSRLAEHHQGRRQLLHHLGRNKQAGDVPTRVGERYTSRACHQPTQSNVVKALQVRSSLDHRELHLLQLLQAAQL